jgi:choline dehydrogenase-like flavoprotein
MGDDPERSVTDGYGRTWEVPNLWICDGSVMPTGGGVNPSLTIQALACRTGDHIRELGSRREL